MPQIVVLVTKAVADQFGAGGIADQVIKFNGFPCLENEEVAFNVEVASVMKRVDEVECLVDGISVTELGTSSECTVN